MKYKNLLQTIGNTPLVEIDFGTPPKILAKLEYLNPGGSIKDRSALFMIEKAEHEGKLKPGGTIIDASSGNHGIALAMIGTAKGYKVIVTSNNKFSTEKVQTLKAYGAQVIMCKNTEFVSDPESYHSVAVRLQQEIPNSYMPNQYFNVENALAHYTLLGPEIWKQTNGTITHYVCAAGTGGTISGSGKFLKEKNKNIKVIAVDSVNSYRSTKGHPKPYKIEGIGVDFDSDVLDYSVIDEFFCVTDEETIAMLKSLASQYGFLVGPSSGAVTCATQALSKQLSSDDMVVMIMGDSGRAYLTKGYY